jgi:hypothetical protein
MKIVAALKNRLRLLNISLHTFVDSVLLRKHNGTMVRWTEYLSVSRSAWPALGEEGSFYTHSSPYSKTFCNMSSRDTPKCSSCLTTPHINKPHNTTTHLTTPYNTTPHNTSPHHTTLHHTSPHHNPPHHSRPHYTTPHHSTLHHTTADCTTTHYTTPDNIAPQHSTPHHTTPHHWPH